MGGYVLKVWLKEKEVEQHCVLGGDMLMTSPAASSSLIDSHVRLVTEAITASRTN